ncbi:MAG TPA: hypothetical protein VMR31_05340 [Myxococcota bacterium]|nr:hypothetical protein [Myxococcota bacterium]
MTPARKSLSWVLAAGLILGIAAPAFAQAPPASTTSDADPATRDALRTGGCTGCFDTQAQAAIASFATVKRVFRVCQTGGGVTVNQNCDGSGHGALAQFIEIQGDLRNSSTDALGLGVPGGQSNATIRISGNGSGNGLNCASASGPTPIGYIAPEGFDGIPNTADDAGGTGVFGAVGPGTNSGGGGAVGNANDTSPKLAACDTKLDDPASGYQFSIPGTTPTAYPAKGTQEFCVVNVDQGTDAQIKNDRVGAAAPGTITHLGQLDPTNETTNLSLSCDTAFADLPPGDFSPQTGLNTAAFANSDTFGAEIFKIIASRDVHANAGANVKIQLGKPEIEGLFGPSNNLATCSWQQVGGQSSLVHASGVDINVCYRSIGSGTREVFRNTWMANTRGDATQGQGSTSGVIGTCGQRVGSLTGTPTVFHKQLIEGGGTNDVKICVQQHTGSVGYVDGFINPATTEFYSVPVDGVDPDTNNLKQLVRCGMYRYWGPLAGGTGGRLGGVATAPKTAHLAAMKNPAIFFANEAYAPFSGLNYAKTATDGASFTQFVSTAPPDANACPGTIAPPGTIPP